MIKTVSDFLDQLKQKETELIKKYEFIDHPVLIGDMYEGLTQDLMSKAIFKGFDLKIVSGKIKNSKGDLSNEIDCMLVVGNGDKLPYAEKYIYHFSQVIAVIQVKKSLFGSSLEDSYSNLRSVIDVSREPEKDGEAYLMHCLRDAWKGLLKMDLPIRVDLHNYSEKEQYIYHTLLMEAFLPLRIVFGYYGYKTEYSLREGFSNFLDKQVTSGKPGPGFGVGSFPSLIICGKNSIIKNNGMPYSLAFLKQEFYWPIYITSPENPIYHLLELIWTRLSYKFEISSSIFGSDFHFENMHEFLNCKFGKDSSGNLGWEYSYTAIPEKILNLPFTEKVEWSPVFLTDKQYIFIQQVSNNEYINFDTNPEFIETITRDGTDLRQFLDELIKTDLIYERNNEIRLLTDECVVIFLPDGRFCAGENKNGEMTNWFANYTKENKKNI